jgi:hypothetical protein
MVVEKDEMRTSGRAERAMRGPVGGRKARGRWAEERWRREERGRGEEGRGAVSLGPREASPALTLHRHHLSTISASDTPPPIRSRLRFVSVAEEGERGEGREVEGEEQTSELRARPCCSIDGGGERAKLTVAGPSCAPYPPPPACPPATFPP